MAAMLDNNKESSDERGGWFGRARRFLSEVRNETTRVTWPSRREVWATTLVVILTSTVFGVYLWTIDLGLSRAVAWVMKSFGG